MRRQLRTGATIRFRPSFCAMPVAFWRWKGLATFWPCGHRSADGDTVQCGGGIRAKLANAIAVIVPGRQVRSNNLFRSTALLIGIVIGILIAIIVAKSV